MNLVLAHLPVAVPDPYVRAGVEAATPVKARLLLTADLRNLRHYEVRTLKVMHSNHGPQTWLHVVAHAGQIGLYLLHVFDTGRGELL
jgi:hypothetical protein